MPSFRKTRAAAPGLLSLLGVLLAVGCGDTRPLAPVRGQVLYNEQPVQFGSVAFQPASGQPAQAEIQPDGTFELATRGEGPGAVVGLNQIRITCYEGQNPARRPDMAAGDVPLGNSLIPARYTRYETSGLTATIDPQDNEPVILRLTD